MVAEQDAAVSAGASAAVALIVAESNHFDEITVVATFCSKHWNYLHHIILAGSPIDLTTDYWQTDQEWTEAYSHHNVIHDVNLAFEAENWRRQRDLVKMPSVIHQPYMDYSADQNVGLVKYEEIDHRGEGMKCKKILELELVHSRNDDGGGVVVPAAAAQGMRMSWRDALSPNWTMVVMTSVCLQEYYQFQEPADQASKEIPPHVPIRQQMNLKGEHHGQHNEKHVDINMALYAYMYVHRCSCFLHSDGVGS